MYRFRILVIVTSFLSGLLAGGQAFSDTETKRLELSSYYDSSSGNIKVSELNFRNGANLLAGTLFVPADVTPSAVVVAAVGAGGVSYRESWRGAMAPLWRLVVEHLVSKGIVFFIYDKPGVGLSSGDWVVQTIEERAAELLAAVRFVDDRVPDGIPIGLLGFSEGGVVAELAATGEPGISFIITLSSPAISMKKIAVDEGICLMHCRGVSGFEASLRSAAIRIRFHLIDLISKFYRPHDHLYYTIGYKPAVALRALTQPMLAVFAGNDCTVQPQINIEALQRTFGGDSGNRALFIEVVEGADHLFRPTDPCGPDPGDEKTAPGLPDAMDNEGFWSTVFSKR